MRRTACAALAVTTVVAGLSSFAVGGAASGAPAAAADPYGTVFNILPPGSNGTVTALDLPGVGPDLVADESNPENFADQLEMYDALTEVQPDAITREDVERLFKSAGFTPEEVASTETPRDGVTIERDAYGVPFITGETFEDVEFGAGYAATQDRMFLMDALRHSGRARLAEFAGDTPGNVAMDQAQLRSAFYTEEEATAQIDKAAERAGDGGPQLAAGVDAFLEGINAAQEAMCPGGLVVAPSCPAEYAALQQTPEEWTRADIVYLASLVGGIFGKGGGKEYDNAIWLQRLIGKFGVKKGKRVYNDLREKNDPEAPATSEIYTPYQLGGVKPRRPGVALPDVDGPTAPGSGAPTGDSAAPPSSATARMDLPGYSIEIPLASHGMSNAILVTAEKSATGNPLAVMGPQTSYFTPQLLTEQVLNGPGHPGPRGRVRRDQPVRPARPRRRLRLVGHELRQRQHRHRRRAALQHRRQRPDDRVHRLPRRRRVRRDGAVHPQRDHHAQRWFAEPAEDLRVPGAAHRTRPGAAPHHRRRGPGRHRQPAVDVRPRGRLRRRLLPAQRPRLRRGRRQLPAGRRQHRLHVQLVLRRQRGHLLLLLGPAAGPAEECRRRPAALGRQRSTTGRAGCPSSATRARPTPSAATSSAGTTSRRRASPPATRSGATARSTARSRSRSGSGPS